MDAKELARIRERAEKARVGRWDPRIASDGIPALLAEIDRLRAEVEEMRGALLAAQVELEFAPCRDNPKHTKCLKCAAEELIQQALAGVEEVNQS